MSAPTFTLNDDATVHVVSDGEYARDKVVRNRVGNDCIQVNKRRQLVDRATTRGVRILANGDTMVMVIDLI